MRLAAPMPDLGRIGVWSWDLVSAPADEVRTAVRQWEQMGYRAAWYPESRGREAFVTAALLLSSTERLIAVTGIANIWARDANAAASGATALGEAWPGRFVLGLGVSHAPSVARRGFTYERPMQRMREYLDAIEQASFMGPEASPDVPVLLAALGPKMLHLSAERTAGAHPYFITVEHTRVARETMGPDAFLAPEVPIVMEPDPEAAREIARSHTAGYLRLDNYRRNLLRVGWSDDDVAGGGSDALVDAVVAWGNPATVAQRIEDHFTAGADHVSLQVLNDGPFPQKHLEALAGELGVD